MRQRGCRLFSARPGWYKTLEGSGTCPSQQGHSDRLKRQNQTSLLDTSDKVFWHGYIDFYERFFQERSFSAIAEIGLFHGNSVRWMLERFPDARIFGADILAVQPEWPVDPRFAFTQLDQGDPPQVRRFLSQADFDMIIEDGSHDPVHQVLALMEGVRALKSGGLYILEDIHTSHPAYPDGRTGLFSRRKPKLGNALSVLLAIDHYKRLSIPVDEARGSAIAKDSLLKTGDVLFLAER